jgi:hypothetical protein
MKIALMISLFLMGIGNAFAWQIQSPKIEIFVDGIQAQRYYHQGTTYVEATKEKKYSIRIANPLGERIAVALSVDGLNTINAQHTQARLGPKWVLGPYESVVINGWQVNTQQARQFVFTTEATSYGAWLGKTENLGLISAAFFRERPRPVLMPMPAPPPYSAPIQRSEAAEKLRDQASTAGREAESRAKRDESRNPQSEYAATGMGEPVNHEVQRVYLDLEDRPFSTIDLRYEFRPVLVKLGVLPHPAARDPLIRRERAKGFSDGDYCPEP